MCNAVDALRALDVPEGTTSGPRTTCCYEAIWQSVLEAGRQAGTFTVGDRHLTRLHLLDLCTGVMRWYRPDGEHSLDSIVDHVVDTSLLVVEAHRGSHRLRAADLPQTAPMSPVSLDEVADRRRSAS
ncbi:hypothetical protein ABZ725_47960 [Streptomyces sp. NPDC006872]|uniref:hypothetical protein n=1 Tax=Streptomyces sp. NPDC006872 TaxID=3155720 RepID=UPI0033C34EE8